jgi:hypothetical protein
MANLVNMIIYDRSNYDSLTCAAIMKYHILHDPDNNYEVVAYNWDEIPYTADTHMKTIKSQCYTISLCATIIDPNIIRIMYNALYEKFASVQFNPRYKDIVASANSNIFQLFKQRLKYSELSEHDILCVGQSASLTLFQYLYKDVSVPLFYMYLDSFITDSYYDYGELEQIDISRNDVIKFEKGLIELFDNDFDNYYDGMIGFYTPTDIPDKITREIANIIGEAKFNEANEYIISHFKKYGGVTWEGNEKGGIIRKVLPMFTSEKLSSEILTNPIFDGYDSIVTFNQLKTGDWEMCLYNIIHNVEVEDFDHLTIEQKRTIELNTFSAGIYIKNMYNGMGNDIYGWTIITNAKFCRILSLKKI